MAEDLKSKMAAIAAAKEGRAKQAVEAKLNAEIGEAQESAGQENALRDKATALEARVGVAEQSSKEAEEAIRQAQGMLAEGGLEPDEQAIIESGIAEEQQKIEELNVARTELADVKAEIEQLNTKPEAEAPVKTEASIIKDKKDQLVNKDLKQLVMDDIKGQSEVFSKACDEAFPPTGEIDEFFEDKIAELQMMRAEFLASANVALERIIKEKDVKIASTIRGEILKTGVFNKFDQAIDRGGRKGASINWSADSLKELRDFVKLGIQIEEKMDQNKDRNAEARLEQAVSLVEGKNGFPKLGDAIGEGFQVASEDKNAFRELIGLFRDLQLSDKHLEKDPARRKQVKQIYDKLH